MTGKPPDSQFIDWSVVGIRSDPYDNERFGAYAFAKDKAVACPRCGLGRFVGRSASGGDRAKSKLGALRCSHCGTKLPAR